MAKSSVSSPNNTSYVRTAFLWFTTLMIGGCAGDGCGCGFQAAPFPASERFENAAQIRLTDTAVTKLEADPAALVAGFLGGDGTTFPIPPACDANDDPKICCDGNGMPMDPCGPVNIDLVAQGGDLPRLEINPGAGDHLDVILRARVQTGMDLTIETQGANCDVSIDTTAGNPDDISITIALDFEQDPQAGTTRLGNVNATVGNFANEDFDLGGDFLCTIAGALFKGTVRDQIVEALEGTIADAISELACKQCPGGTVGECGEFADGCDAQVCMKGGECLQELGIAGRLPGAALGGFSPGITGSLDMYDVAGGYSTTNAGGVSLGVLGGALPAATERDRCGPVSTRPADVAIPVSNFFNGNTRPDTGGAFDVGIGVHQHQLDMLAWAAYESGFLCLNVGTQAVDLLTSETLAVLMPSLLEILHGRTSGMVLGLRPQAPPTVRLGLGTTLDGEIVDPLLTFDFTGMEIDIYAQVDNQWIRTMTLVTDLTLPLNLEPGEAGELVPVLGAADELFTNISVINSEALSEDPADLAGRFPALLDVAIPLVADGLSGFALPEIGNLTLDFQPDGITSVEGNTFLALYADLVTITTMPTRVHTTAELVDTFVPEPAVFAHAELSRELRPRAVIAVDGDRGDLEFQYRVNDGLWSPFVQASQLTVSRDSMWLQGRHMIEVRARVVGEPHSLDDTPVVIPFDVDTTPPRVRFAHLGAEEVFVDGVDWVDRGELTAEYRIGDSEWLPTGALPAKIDLAGAPPSSLEVRVTDRSGNTGYANPVLGFHGSADDGGCNCSIENSGGGLAAMLVVLGAMLLGLGRRRKAVRPEERAKRASRRTGATLAPVALALLIAALPACSCGGSSTKCLNDMCLEGEVPSGPTGRYLSIAADDSQVLLSAYDESLGDLVLVRVDPGGGDPVFEAIDGVPIGNVPQYESDTYRGGIAEPGDNVGTHTSLAIAGGRARIAYHDEDNGALKFAREQDGQWVIHAVDSEDGAVVGIHNALTLDNGVPTIAYIAYGVDGADGSKRSQLKYARAATDVPSQASDWTITIAEDVTISCAGLCGSGLSCIEATDEAPETCRADSGDCTAACGDAQLCVAGACVGTVADPPAYDVPNGTGLFVDNLLLNDGRTALVYYNREETALKIATGDTSGFTVEFIDGELSGDRGMWATAAVDPTGVVHIAYQDALGDQLMYTTWNGTPGAPEIVDDGMRSGETRPHPVGAGASLYLRGADATVIYQDGATSDLSSASRSAGSWSRSDLETGAFLYGFHNAVATGGGMTWLGSYFYDRSVFPPGEILVRPAQ